MARTALSKSWDLQTTPLVPAVCSEPPRCCARESCTRCVPLPLQRAARAHSPRTARGSSRHVAATVAVAGQKGSSLSSAHNTFTPRHYSGWEVLLASSEASSASPEKPAMMSISQAQDTGKAVLAALKPVDEAEAVVKRMEQVSAAVLGAVGHGGKTPRSRVANARGSTLASPANFAPSLNTAREPGEASRVPSLDLAHLIGSPPPEDEPLKDPQPLLKPPSPELRPPTDQPPPTASTEQRRVSISADSRRSSDFSGSRRQSFGDTRRSSAQVVQGFLQQGDVQSAIEAVVAGTIPLKRRVSVGQRMAALGSRLGGHSSLVEELESAADAKDEGKTSGTSEIQLKQVSSPRPRSRGFKLSDAVVAAMVADVPQSARKEKWKVFSKQFEAPLTSFQDLINVENQPMLLSEAFERIRHLSGGPNFAWERSYGAYGGQVNITFPMMMWYQHSWEQETKKTRTCCSVSFLHKPGCAYIYQPVLPVTTLIIEPKQIYRPMFQMDPRSFHTFKLAWRHFLDFGSTDYRAIVGDQLERWTAKCKSAIEKPFNATYWLLLMVGSYYKETLVHRQVATIPEEEPPKRVPVICIDSFMALSALLFSPERQVLYAGVDPTHSYLRWLQHIGDQHSGRKESQHKYGETMTVFEMNELFDVPVIIIYYGRPSEKAKETNALAWVGNPTLVKSYLLRYGEDNKCVCQLEHAMRLYTYSCSLGERRSRKGKVSGNLPENSWNCWNGLKVCEIGVPLPSTQAAFFSPFVNTKEVAVFCPVHGPDSDREKRPAKKRGKKAAGTHDSDDPDSPSARTKGHADFDRQRFSLAGSRSSSILRSGSDCSDSESSQPESLGTVQQSDSNSATSGRHRTKTSANPNEGLRCTCPRYFHAEVKNPRHHKSVSQQPGDTASVGVKSIGSEEEVRKAFSAVGEYDLVHCFAAVLAGGLNLAKMVIRLHFSIDPTAYDNLPDPARSTWQDVLIPWYKDLHRTDVHGRSRYGLLLQSVLRGLIGDGYTSGLLYEVLDSIREGATGDQDKVDGEDAQRVRSTAVKQSSPMRPTESTLQPTAAEEAKEANKEDLKKADKSNIGSMKTISEFYGCESVIGHRGHFERFSQWCHSAHLIPFLLRCYRRSGIAGLATGQHLGGHRHGVVPTHPLVLPTVPNFCYGHCYPFHKVQQYFYAGTEHIVCSIDDSSHVDADKATLELVAGQDRINSHCWFRVADADVLAAISSSQAPTYPAGFRTGSRKSTIGTSSPGSANFDLFSRLVSDVDGKRAKSNTKPVMGRILQAVREREGSMSPHIVRTKKRATTDLTLNLIKGKNAKSGVISLRAAAARRAKQAILPGKMTAEDPFFWFCHQDYSVYTYPARNVPRQILNDAASLEFRYSDFASRSGTPTGRRSEAEADEFEDGEVQKSQQEYPSFGTDKAPPSICLFQPTELTDFVRKRWEVQTDFADDERFLLGDANFFPGAMGHRFTFEAKTDNVERYVLLSDMPQAFLVYQEHSRGIPNTSRRDTRREEVNLTEDASSSESETEALPSHLRHVPHFHRKRRGAKLNERTHVPSDNVQTIGVMLPPFLTGN